jgi:ribosome-binding protein aMBF1 (putative translation factor)
MSDEVSHYAASAVGDATSFALASGAEANGSKEVVSVSEDADQREVMEYLDELEQRLPRFARRAAAIPPDKPYSAEWFSSLGKFWRNAREERGLSRREAAKRANVSANQLRLLEVGLGEPEDLRDGFMKRFADALGDSVNLLHECKERFGVP